MNLGRNEIIKLSYVSDKKWSKVCNKYCNTKNFSSSVKWNNFIDVRNVLSEEDVDYWLSCGAVLTIYRDKKLLKRDWDIDVDVYSDDLRPKYDKVRDRLMSIGFISRGRSTEKSVKLNLIRGMERVTVRGLYFDSKFDKDRKYILSNVFRYPVKFFDKNVIETISYRGDEARVPSPVKKYIVYFYGKNWKIPLESRKESRKDLIKRGVIRKNYARDRGWCK